MNILPEIRINGGSEIIKRIRDGNEGLENQDSYWQRYKSTLVERTPTALDVLEADCTYIFQQGIQAHQAIELDALIASRYKSGLVMGAVQSGKTGSMIGVTALALDEGFDIVVILAGTRLALWKQTYSRVLSQLRPKRTDIFLPTPDVMQTENGQPALLRDLYPIGSPRVLRALHDRHPMVLVVMKHAHHLRAAGEFLHNKVYSQISELGRDVNLLVLDDEADDGSVLDAEVEASMDPNLVALKQIPRHIVDLWADRFTGPDTCAPNLHSTYLAYTATPQANTLQASQNPLSPKDFLIALRTPSNEGTVVKPREVTFREPAGYLKYYYGGRAFYRDTAGAMGLVRTESDLNRESDSLPVSPLEWIQAAVRNYLVSCAIQLWRAEWQGNLRDIRSKPHPDRELLKKQLPPTHTMLFHPSALIDQHFSAAARIREWTASETEDEAVNAITEGVRDLGGDGLLSDLVEHELIWRQILGSYTDSARMITTIFGVEPELKTPKDDQWEEIRGIIENVVIPNVRLSIINSDPNADDRPQFDCQETDSGWCAPQDIFTIFVSGNVMARGLTLEGLATSLFLRSTKDPLADTQMQMQRWFGYRGPFIDLCRVFMTKDQLSLFIRYHESDLSLRLQVLGAMNNEDAIAPRPLIIGGVDFRATGKIANTRNIPLCPGPYPFISVVNAEVSSDPNYELAQKLFSNGSDEVVTGPTTRGRILTKPLTLSEAADLLDQLSYPTLNLDPFDEESTRWKSVSDIVRPVGNAHPDMSLYRYQASVEQSTDSWVNPSQSPFTVAAYLRLWEVALSQKIPGMVPTDNGQLLWSDVDLDQKKREAPEFHVGLRFGGGLVLSGEDGWAFDLPLMERAVKGNKLVAQWGSRQPTPGYNGDQNFDYAYHHDERDPALMAGGSFWRPAGAPGLILFHIVDRGEGKTPMATVGVAIPIGGPDHFAARSRR